jgi:hypothetical protein
MRRRKKVHIALLIMHGLFAVALLGAITHQTASAWLPARKQAGSFGGRFRAVSAAGYTNAIVVLYLCTFVLGAIIYPEFRISIRGVLEELDTPAAMGSFELKEHFAVVGLALLPAYWSLWRLPLADEYSRTRKALTSIIAFIIWWNFLVGHVVNNFRGYGA